MAMDTEVPSAKVRQVLLALRPLVHRVDRNRWQWMGPLTAHDGREQLQALEEKVQQLQEQVDALTKERDDSREVLKQGIAERGCMDDERRELRAKVAEMMAMLG